MATHFALHDPPHSRSATIQDLLNVLYPLILLLNDPLALLTRLGFYCSVAGRLKLAFEDIISGDLLDCCAKQFSYFHFSARAVVCFYLFYKIVYLLSLLQGSLKCFYRRR